jgi:putative PIN family toxin of toxin-antitoxin system
MRLVLDTCILVAAFRSRNGASRLLLNLLIQRKFQIVATPALFFEYEDVLCRSKHVEVHGFSRSEIAVFIESLARFTVLVPRVHFQVKPQLRDAGDELVLEAAVNGYAEAIVTFNLADFLPAASEFGIQVVKPGSILKERFSL